jgi:error-prone DNA polymerase
MERVLNGKPRRAGWPIDEQIGDGGDSPAWSRKRGSYQPLDMQRPASSVPYAELHAHSAYSFLDGASTPEELVEEAARLDLRAIALTDHDGLYGVVRFAEAAKELDIATVFGAELSLGGGDRTEEPDPRGPHLLVLARGPEGYRRLSRQLATAHLAGGEKGVLRYDYDALTEAAGGHWHILTGCRKGHVRQALSRGGPEAAEEALADLVDRFGRDRVSIELTHHGHPLDDERNAALAELAPGPQLDRRGGRLPCAAWWFASPVRRGDGAGFREGSRGGDGRGGARRAVRIRAGADRPAVAAVRRSRRTHRGQLAAAPGDDGRPQQIRAAGAGAAGIPADRA